MSLKKREINYTSQPMAQTIKSSKGVMNKYEFDRHTYKKLRNFAFLEQPQWKDFFTPTTALRDSPLRKDFSDSLRTLGAETHSGEVQAILGIFQVDINLRVQLLHFRHVSLQKARNDYLDQN